MTNRIEEHEELLLAFESAWMSGPPNILAFAEEVPDSERAIVIEELMLIDLEHRLRRGHKIDRSFYRDKICESGGESAQFERLLLEEMRLQSKMGSDVSRQEIIERCGEDTLLAGRVWDTWKAESSGESIEGGGSLATGTVVAHYELQETIGTGAFSTVYLAKDTRLDRMVALKFLNATASGSDQLQTRLRLEARMQALLEHECIAPVYDFGVFREQPFIASKFIRGRTLHSLLENPDESAALCSDPRLAAKTIARLAEAAHHAHQRGVVHRDIKPANVIVDGDRPVLIDFGLAQANFSSQVLTQEGDMLGTPAYMSPEQAAGKAWDSDARSDVYSLGAVLYHMVTGSLPFSGPTSMVLMQVLEHAPQKPQKRNPRIPHDLQVIILKCLEKNPEDRYPTAAALAEDLTRFVDGEPILAKPTGRLKYLYRWCLRKPGLATLAAACLLLTVFLGGMASMVFRLADERDRAKSAEDASQRLLGITTVNAGTLALQRGEVVAAANSFDEALALGVEDQLLARLRLIECCYILRRFDQGSAQLELVSRLNPSGEELGELLLWRAEFAHAKGLPLEKTEPMIREAATHPLRPADRAYSSALLADSTPEAVAQLRVALEEDPFHFRARQMLITSLLSLARVTESGMELSVAIQLFPESQDLKLLKALQLACSRDLPAANEQLENAGLEEALAHRWQGMCQFLYGFCTQPNLKFRASTGALELPAMLSVLNEFRTNHSALLASRQWHLPIGVARKFRRFLATVGEPQPIDDGDSIYPKLVAAHPEPSLQLIAAEAWLAITDFEQSTEEEVLENFAEARKLFIAAATEEGFLPGVSEYANYGLLSLAALEALKFNHAKDENFQRMRDYSPRVTPDTITRVSVARLYGIGTLLADDRSEARKWFTLAYDLATLSEDEERIVDSLFHLAVIARRNHDWIRVHQLCSELLVLAPDRQDASNFQQEAVDAIGAMLAEGQ